MSRTEISQTVRRQVLCEIGDNPFRTVQDSRRMLWITVLITCLMGITVLFSVRIFSRTMKAIVENDNPSRILRFYMFGAIWTTVLWVISVFLFLHIVYALAAALFCGDIDYNALITFLAVCWGALASVPMKLCLDISSCLNKDYFYVRKTTKGTQMILPTAEKNRSTHHNDLAHVEERTLDTTNSENPPPCYYEDKSTFLEHVPDGSSHWQETNGIRMLPSAVTRAPSSGTNLLHSVPRRTSVPIISSNSSQDGP